MESAISAIILFALGIFAATTISQTYMETQDSLWTAQQSRQEASLERQRTDLEITRAETEDSGALIRVTVRNNGQVKLADFDRWDLIVQYYSDPPNEPEPNRYPDAYNIQYLPYTPGAPQNLQWTVSGIYANAGTLTPEAFEPGILNPDEEMIIQARVEPSIALTTTNMVIINTPNGISASAQFQR
jgi:hypothetical protein